MKDNYVVLVDLRDYGSWNTFVILSHCLRSHVLWIIFTVHRQWLLLSLSSSFHLFPLISSISTKVISLHKDFLFYSFLLMVHVNFRHLFTSCLKLLHLTDRISLRDCFLRGWICIDVYTYACSVYIYSPLPMHTTEPLQKKRIGERSAGRCSGSLSFHPALQVRYCSLKIIFN